MTQQKEVKTSKMNIPYSLNQESAEVKIKKWFGDQEVRFDLIFTTANSYISICLSQKQFNLLKDRIREF